MALILSGLRQSLQAKPEALSLCLHWPARRVCQAFARAKSKPPHGLTQTRSALIANANANASASASASASGLVQNDSNSVSAPVSGLAQPVDQQNAASERLCANSSCSIAALVRADLSAIARIKMAFGHALIVSLLTNIVCQSPNTRPLKKWLYRLLRKTRTPKQGQSTARRTRPHQFICA
jgi:hypothetical protein